MATAELLSRQDNIARIKATIGATEVDDHFKHVYREFAKGIDIPGFRKGKVPENVIRQRVGMESITSACADALKRFAISQAVEELKLTPRYGTTRWASEPDPEPGQSIEYEFSLPVLPEVTLPDYRAFELSVPVLAVSDEMKATYRRRLVDRFTEYPEKEGAAEKDDGLLVAFTSASADSDEPLPLAADNLMYTVGDEGNFPGWDEHLAGSKAGDEHNFDFTVPEDFSDPRVAGQPVKINLSVESVHEVKPPTLDDAFVKEHLRLDSADKLDEFIDEALDRERDQQVHQMKSDMGLRRLTAELQAEVSDDMVEDELDGLVKDYDTRLRQQGGSLDEFLKGKGQELKEYRQELRNAAVQKIKVFLAIKTIAEAEDLNATADDFRRYALYLIQYEGIPPEKLKELMDEPEFMREATFQILREKVLVHIVESVQFTETDAAKAEGGQQQAVDTKSANVEEESAAKEAD
jgi:trigger factor